MLQLGATIYRYPNKTYDKCLNTKYIELTKKETKKLKKWVFDSAGVNPFNHQRQWRFDIQIRALNPTVRQTVDRFNAIPCFHQATEWFEYSQICDVNHKSVVSKKKWHWICGSIRIHLFLLGKTCPIQVHLIHGSIIWTFSILYQNPETRTLEKSMPWWIFIDLQRSLCNPVSSQWMTCYYLLSNWNTIHLYNMLLCSYSMLLCCDI